jgi:hypothetical protein
VSGLQPRDKPLLPAGCADEPNRSDQHGVSVFSGSPGVFEQQPVQRLEVGDRLQPALSQNDLLVLCAAFADEGRPAGECEASDEECCSQNIEWGTRLELVAELLPKLWKSLCDRVGEGVRVVPGEFMDLPVRESVPDCGEPIKDRPEAGWQQAERIDERKPDPPARVSQFVWESIDESLLDRRNKLSLERCHAENGELKRIALSVQESVELVVGQSARPALRHARTLPCERRA